MHPKRLQSIGKVLGKVKGRNSNQLFLVGGCDGNSFSFRIIVTIRSSYVSQHRNGPGKHHGDNQTQDDGGPNTFGEKANAIITRRDTNKVR